MVGFFRNAFQQTGFTPTEDFKIAAAANGGFDFGPGGARLAGDDAFPRLVQNLQDSFAKTAWQLVQEGRPFTEVLTTNRFVMTTALKSLYIQIEMPADAPFNNGSAQPAWKLDYSGNPIPIEQAISTHDVQRRGARDRQRQRLLHQLPRRRDGARAADFTGHVADLPAPARVHAALPVLGQPDLLRAARRSPTSRPATSATGRG